VADPRRHIANGEIALMRDDRHLTAPHPPRGRRGAAGDARSTLPSHSDSRFCEPHRR
jgi:hypothetical protein